MDAVSTQPEAGPDEGVSGPETVVRKVLRAPSTPVDHDASHRLFSVAILLSAARCLATYIVLPIAVPLVGSSVTTSAAIGLPLSVVAIVFDIRAVRRFWLADHQWRWAMTFIYTFVMLLVVGLAIHDLVRL